MIAECIEVPDMDAPTENGKTTLQCPPSKKLKQARLPFKMLVSKTTLNPPTASIGKKRKLSDQEVPLSKLPKSVKTDEKKSKNKETSHIATEENEVSSSSETEKHYEAEHSEIKLSKNNKSGLIETFFNKCQTKNDIVHSTSDVVDLSGPEEKRVMSTTRLVRMMT
ncbi:uncharacterized protein LOC106179887 isoform X2 [Lingula anatina]|uniref:Uncharacterized protein LOC106179887 isoform X2 n=1 Tax=Lingula anatina TaxID=7574 RepID=A0A1S3K9H3_LINAN|nr:uncharacterized protein LOC106179887 isoform X2 [Lingula anatina]|eukprot:XP_013419147.1 uncharacterized protein LOC106179887 isoform X2 [Lingula anatina]